MLLGWAVNRLDFGNISVPRQTTKPWCYWYVSKIWILIYSMAKRRSINARPAFTGVKLASNWRSIRSRNRGPNRQNVIQIVGTDNISIAVNLSFLWKPKSSFVFYANWARRSRKREKTATSPKKIVTKTTKTWFNGRMTNSTWHRYVSIGIFENILKK